MPKKTDTGLNSPARNKKEQLANYGGMPPTKAVEAIEKENRPPSTPPASKLGGGKSVRV